MLEKLFNKYYVRGPAIWKYSYKFWLKNMETGIGIIIYWGNTQSDFFIIYLLSVFLTKM